MRMKLYLPLIRGGVMLALFWIIQKVVEVLPMLRGLYFPVVNLTASSGVEILISLLMIWVLWETARQFSKEMQNAFPSWPQSRQVIISLTLLIALIVLYDWLLPIVTRFFPRDIWIYQDLFAVLVLYPLIRGGIAIYRSVDPVVQLLSKRAEKSIATPNIEKPSNAAYPCPNCGIQNVPIAKFCSSCGVDLSKKSVAVEPICPKCGAKLDPAARFCISCGTPVMQPA